MRKTFEIPLDIPDVTIQTVETDRHVICDHGKKYS